MKRCLTLTILLALITLGIGGYSRTMADGECVPDANGCDPNLVPFPFDANDLTYKLLGWVTTRTGRSINVEIGVCDPDEDPVVITLLAGPPDAMVLNENNMWLLRWTPTLGTIGIFVVDVQAQDIPPLGDTPLQDRGTFLVNVLKRNQPPVLIPSCGG